MSCSPTRGRGTAACVTSYPGVAATSSFNSPSYWQIDNAESSVYLAYFTSSEPFPAATTTAAAASTSSGFATAPSSRTLGPLARLGIGLGVPLGVCACAVLGILLLLRYGRQKQLSRTGLTNNVVRPEDVAEDIENKTTAESGNGNGSGDVSELHEAEGRSAANELEGSVGEGRMELA